MNPGAQDHGMGDAAAHRTGSFASGDVEVFYRSFGSRTQETPIVIAHGLSYFSYDWIDVAACLARDREVVALDLRGFGDSSWSPSKSYELEHFSSDLVALLNHMGWAKAFLVGHSMGGRICLCTAAWHASRVSGLVCLDFAPDVAPAGRKKVAERIGNQPDIFGSVGEAMAFHGAGELAASTRRWEAFLRKEGEGFVLKRDLHFRDTFRQVLKTAKVAPSALDLWALVRQLCMPALFVRGRDSDMFAAETLLKLRAAGSTVSVAEITGGHALMEDNPAGVVDQVSRFVACVG